MNVLGPRAAAKKIATNDRSRCIAARRATKLNDAKGSTTAYRTTREQRQPSIPNLVPSACALKAEGQREFRTLLPPLTERLASEKCSELNYSPPVGCLPLQK